MYPTLFIGLVLLVTAARYAWRPDRTRVHVITALGVVTLISGCLGTITGIMRTLTYAEDNRTVWIGFAESMNNIAFALVLLVLGGIGVVIGLSRKASTAPAEPVAM